MPLAKAQELSADACERQCRRRANAPKIDAAKSEKFPLLAEFPTVLLGRTVRLRHSCFIADGPTCRRRLVEVGVLRCTF
jgi:hypothetical protein